MTDIITTLHPEQDEETNLYPNVKKENIPNESIDMSKLGNDVKSLINSMNELRPSGADTSTNILAFTENKGIYIGSDTGNWYYWNGTQYVDGGVYQTAVNYDELENDLIDLGKDGYALYKDVTWNDGYIDKWGLVKASTLSKYSTPFVLRKGETIKVGTENNSITIIGTTNSTALNIGDTVTKIQTTSDTLQYETHEYTAPYDMNITVCVLKSNYILRKRNLWFQNSVDVIDNFNLLKDYTKYNIHLNCGLDATTGNLTYRKGYFVSDYIKIGANFNVTWNYGNLGYNSPYNIMVLYDTNKVIYNYWNTSQTPTDKSRVIYIAQNGYFRFVGLMSDLGVENISVTDTYGISYWNYKLYLNKPLLQKIDVQTIGHAYNGVGVANTLSHFDWWTKTKKAKFIECDIVNTSDGIPVICHVAPSYTVYNSNDVAVTLNIANTTYAALMQYTWTPSTAQYPSQKILDYKDMLQYVRRKGLFLWIDCTQTDYEAVRQIFLYALELGIENKIFFEQYQFYFPQANRIIRYITSTSDIDNALEYKNEFNYVMISIPSSVTDETAKTLINYAHTLGLYVEKEGGSQTIDGTIDIFNLGYDFVFSDTISNEDL